MAATGDGVEDPTPSHTPDGARKTLPLFTVDAFSSVPFQGNPAAVCLDSTPQGLSVELMQKIAAEMNISETAYIKQLKEPFETGSRFGLRWFTPTNEVSLCGHATLASAAVLFKCLRNPSSEVVFETLSGDLTACRHGEEISLYLPLNTPTPQDKEEYVKLLKLVVGPHSVQDIQYSASTKKLLVRLDDTVTRRDLECLSPVVGEFQEAHSSGGVLGVIVTVRGSRHTGCVDTQGEQYDFISRYFSPWNGIPEDPVTGSAHTVLAGYWSKQLDKTHLYGRQCSARGGDVRVRLREDGRVDVAGPATVVLRASLSL